jgi:proline iminopeptidase
MVSGPADPNAAREWSLSRGRSRLAVRELGEGRPLMVLHGGPDFDHRYLLPEMDRLATHARLIYYDQRGRGGSYRGETADDVSLATEMADLEAVRAAAAGEPVALLGHSFGALLAAEFAIRRPEQVTHLILMNPPPLSHDGMLALGAELTARRGVKGSARMRALAADPAYQRGAVEPEAEYYRIHFGTTLRSADQLATVVGRLRTGFSSAGTVAARAIEDRLYADTWDRPDYDLRPGLATLAMPTLVIAGDHDFCPPAVVGAIAAAIPDARLVTLEDCGHFAYLERPEAVVGLVAELLARPGGALAG